MSGDHVKSDPIVGPAFKALKQAMIEDEPSKRGSLAHAWHCNIAMSCFDAIMADNNLFPIEKAHKIGNDAASRFMKLCFDVETKEYPPHPGDRGRRLI